MLEAMWVLVLATGVIDKVMLSRDVRQDVSIIRVSPIFACLYLDPNHEAKKDGGAQQIGECSNKNKVFS